jgi:cytochrome c-type biogenesis protein CcmH
MLLFWVAAGVLAAAAAGLILFRAAGARSVGADADPAEALYRRQLGEIDELAERGLIGEVERKTAYAEAGRRLLVAAEAPGQGWSADPRGRAGVLLAAAASAAVALGLYLVLGAPGTPDQPYAKRLEGWQSADLQTLQAPEIAAVMRQVVSQRPNDPEGHRLLAIAEAGAQDYPAAVRALKQAVRLAPQRADLWLTLGQAQTFAAGGKIDADAQRSFRQALALAPGDLSARFYLAVAKSDTGDGKAAAAEFQAILAALPPGDERRGAVQAALAKAEGKPVLQADPQQMAMIRGMVDRLAARLKTNPDDSDGWVRLVRAYSVLGQTKDRDAAYAAARARYAAQPKVLADLDAAARAEPTTP